LPAQAGWCATGSVDVKSFSIIVAGSINAGGTFLSLTTNRKPGPPKGCADTIAGDKTQKTADAIIPLLKNAIPPPS
jgi:hypothetical protein